MDIKIGDIVTWREAPTKNFEPMGILHCEVLELGLSVNKEPVAKILAMGREINVYVKDLHQESVLNAPA
jgi:hypothetical protein